MSQEQVVVFSLGSEEYAVAISQVREIIRYQGATKIPNVAEYVQGIINLRGKIITVVDLARKLALDGQPNTAERRALLLETAGKDLAVLVDEVSEVRWLDEDSIECAAAESLNSGDVIRGVGKDGDRLIILLDVMRLFASMGLLPLQDAG